MSARRKLIGIGSALAVIAAALAVSAGAATPKFASTVHMHGVGPSPGYDHWVGHVHSRKRKCERGRTVTVFYEGSDVGSDTTDRQGHWQIPTAAPGDDPYYASVSRKVVGSGDNKVVCKADRSPSFGFPPPF
jgi:hypothetical protein